MRTHEKQVRSQPNPIKMGETFHNGTYNKNTTKSEKHLHYLAISKCQQNKNPKTRRLRGTQVRHIQICSRDTHTCVPVLPLCRSRKFIIRTQHISLKTAYHNSQHATKCDKARCGLFSLFFYDLLIL